MSFPSTDLPKLEGDKERDTESIRKSVLDLLDKINKQADQIDALTKTVSTFPSAYQNGLFSSGSSANGNWIKYADGTMIQWITKPITTSTATTVTFPIGFIDTNYSLSGAVEVSTLSIIFQLFDSKATGSCRVYCTPNTGSGTFPVDMIFIGKWK